MTKYSSHILATCAFAAIAIGGTSAMAQQQQTTPQTSAATEDNTGEIVVTARRISENLQRVPVAITAFSQDSLKERAVSNSFDLAKSVPGLVTNADSGNASQPSFSIRGRGQVFGAASGSVETYFAEVPLSPPFQMPTLPPQYFDLASAQVLKGPQGTLFGRNTTGGAVLFVPQAPTDQLEGYVRGQLGTYQNAQIEGAINLPFGDLGGLRLAGFAWHRKGYATTVAGRQDSAASANNGAVFNPLTGQYGAGAVTLPSIDVYNQDVLEFRGTLLLRPTDSIENTTLFTWHGDRNRATTQLRDLRTGAALAGGIGLYYPGLLPNDPRVADTDVNLARPRSSTWAVINTTTWDFGENLRAKNIFSYISAKGYTGNPQDVDGSPFPAINLVIAGRALKNRQIYDELQFQGKLGPLDFIVGGNIDLTRQPGANDTINISTNTFDTGGFDEQFRQSRFTTKSLFSSLTYHLTDALTLTAAARHTWDTVGDRSIILNNNPKYVNVAPNPGQFVDCGVNPNANCAQFLSGVRNFKGWSYNFGADYKVSDDLLVYGGFRHGYKRGGFNGRGGSLADFGPEEVNDYFIGTKTSFTINGRRATFNIEGFWDDYKGAQRSFLDLAGGALVTTIQNVPKLRYRGFDMDTTLNLTDWFRLSANYTFVDAKYISYPDNTIATALGVLAAGGAPAAFLSAFAASHSDINRLADNVPALNSRHKVNVQGRFHYTMNDGVEIAFLPSFSYQSKFLINDNASVIPAIGEVLFNGGAPVNAARDGANTAPGYATADMRLEFNHIAERLDLSFNATNITNKTYVVGGAGIWQFGVDTVAYGPPRMFFVEARYRF